MRQGRTLSRARPGNQPLDFDEVTKCAEEQLNTVRGLLQRRGVQQAPLPGEGVPLGPALGACLPPQPLHGLVPGFSCSSHSRVAPAVHILKAALPHADSWELSPPPHIHANWKERSEWWVPTLDVSAGGQWNLKHLESKPPDSCSMVAVLSMMMMMMMILL